MKLTKPIIVAILGERLPSFTLSGTHDQNALEIDYGDTLDDIASDILTAQEQAEAPKSTDCCHLRNHHCAWNWTGQDDMPACTGVEKCDRPKVILTAF